MANRAHRVTARIKPKRIQKHEQKHYWPYIPVLGLLFAIFAVNLMQPLAQKSHLLAYATDMSSSGLLEATNAERTENGRSKLSLNSKLSSAAQSKANDMVKRDYWSHNTPDGKEPWVFISTAGYDYQKAGENLAYGFLTSSSTVSGWMSSASHKANMLDSTFTEVGFGYANSSNFNDDGKQTVVVAMYAKPQVLSVSNTAPASAEPTTASPPSDTTVSTAKPKPQNTAKTAAKSEKAFNNTNDSVEPPVANITRIQTVSSLNGAWSLFVIGLVMGGLVVYLLARHALALKHMLRSGEKLILHHPLLDTVVLSLVLAGSLLLQTSGYIR